MDFVFEGVCASNENVIDVHINKIETTSNFVHKALKSLSCVTETKWHFGEFKQTKWGGDSSLANVVLSHGDLVVSADEVDFREDGFTVEGCREILDMRNWILVGYGDTIKTTIVTAWTPITRLRFGNHMKW